MWTSHMFREYCCRTAGDAHVEFEAGSAAGQCLRHNHKAKFYSITKAGKRQMKLEGLFYDLRFALRGLRRDRAFTLAAIAMLALAIGLNVTVFTVMDAMLFRGFPLVKRNDRLVYLQERYPSGACCLSYEDFEDWRAQAQAFEGLAFVASNRSI